MISRWIQKKENLEISSRKSRSSGSGWKAAYSAAEEKLKEWILEFRKNGIALNTIIIKHQMKHLLENDFKDTYPDASNTFVTSDQWFYRFLHRHELSLCRRTKIGQKLPENLNEKLVAFQWFIIRHRQAQDYDLAQIGNMDETPIFFDMVGNVTVEAKGNKTVHIRTTGNEKNQFTCILSVLANGTKLPPMVIFKGKRLPHNLPPGIIVQMQEKGWMDEQIMWLWIEKVWTRRPGGLARRKSLLVMDSFEGHKTDSVKKRCNEENTDIAIIPGGLTSVLQPLDVCLNKPFKDRLREKWGMWMARGEYELTKGGNLKKPGYNIICKWIIEAWDSISSEMVIKSFKKCGISNDLDGTEDDYIFDEHNLDIEYQPEVVPQDDDSATNSDNDN